MPSVLTVDSSELREALFSESEKRQVQAIETLLENPSELGEPARAEHWALLQEYLLTFKEQPVNWRGGKVFRTLWQQATPAIQDFIEQNFGEGFVPLQSDRDVDYSPIEAALLDEAYEIADRLTLQKMCELAGEGAVQRKWVYFSEVNQFPIADMKTLDTLWLVYSEGKFGFSVQRDMWIGVGKVWEKLWPKMGWKSGNIWTRWPGGFTWNLSAPRGHLPLTNQLRGVRVMDSLMNHPAFSAES
ncbi:MAG: GUN4 N-terminal ARM-like repeat domain-containing protein [Prochlorothrix sp.]